MNVKRGSINDDDHYVVHKESGKIVSHHGSGMYGEVTANSQARKHGEGHIVLKGMQYKSRYKLDEQMKSPKNPYHKAGVELEKYAKKLGDNHMDHDTFMMHANMLKSGQSHSSAKMVGTHDTEPRDVVLDHVWKHAPREAANDYYTVARVRRLREEVITELSSDMLIKYSTAALKSARGHAQKAADAADERNDQNAFNHIRSAEKREAGYFKALSKIRSKLKTT